MFSSDRKSANVIAPNIPLRHEKTCSYITTADIFLGKRRTLSACILICMHWFHVALVYILPGLSCPVGLVIHSLAIYFMTDSEIPKDMAKKNFCPHSPWARCKPPGLHWRSIIGCRLSVAVTKTSGKEDQIMLTWRKGIIAAKANLVSSTSTTATHGRKILETQLSLPSIYSVLLKVLVCPSLPRTIQAFTCRPDIIIKVIPSNLKMNRYRK